MHIEKGESSKDQRHAVSLEIPFLNPQHAFIAKTALQVDREQNATFVTRNLSVEDNVLVVKYEATTVRLLRLATNSFLSSVDLVMRTMENFAPNPDLRDLTDEELEEIRRLRVDDGGGMKGIELKR